MRILFVTPWIPGPQRPRAFGILKMLANEHEVRLICLRDGGGDERHLHEVGLESYEVIRWRRAPGVVRAAAAVPTDQPLQMALVAEPRVRAAVARAIAAWRPDVVHLNVIRSMGFLTGGDVGSGRLVVDLDERRSGYWHQLAQSSRSRVWRLVARTEHRRLAMAEAAVVERSDAILVSSPVDVPEFGPRTRLVRSPHEATSVARRPDGQEILFVGRMSYRANVEAATWFAREVLPRVRARLPGARMLIVGADPTTEVQRLAGDGIEVTGSVPRMDDYYARASVAIIPAQLATGVQMKLIQAAVAGTPMVSTRDCALRAGIDQDALLVADSVAEWVEATCSTLTGTDAAQQRADRATEWADGCYSLSAIESSLRGVYREVKER